MDNNVWHPGYGLIVPYSPGYAGSHGACCSLWAFIALAILPWPQSQTPEPSYGPMSLFGSWHFSSGNVAFPLDIVVCGCKWKELLTPTSLSSPLLWGRTAQSCRGRQGREWRKLEKGEGQVGWETEEGAIQDPRRGWPAVPWTLTGIRTENKNVALEVL